MISICSFCSCFSSCFSFLSLVNLLSLHIGLPLVRRTNRVVRIKPSMMLHETSSYPSHRFASSARGQNRSKINRINIPLLSKKCRTVRQQTESTFRCATTTHDLIRKCKKCINRLNLYSALDLHSSDIVNHGHKIKQKSMKKIPQQTVNYCGSFFVLKKQNSVDFLSTIC